MLLPNMYMNIKLFAQRLTIFNAIQTVVDFEPVQNLTMKKIVCTVQKADPEKLQINNLDFSLIYLEVHADIYSGLKINDQCYYKGYNYKLIDCYPDQDYGYVRAIFEQIKIPVSDPTLRGYIITEDGGRIILESGGSILLEGNT